MLKLLLCSSLALAAGGVPLSGLSKNLTKGLKYLKKPAVPLELRRPEFHVPPIDPEYQLLADEFVLELISLTNSQGNLQMQAVSDIMSSLDILQRAEFIQRVYKYPFKQLFTNVNSVSRRFLEDYSEAKDRFLNRVRELEGLPKERPVFVDPPFDPEYQLLIDEFQLERVELTTSHRDLQLKIVAQFMSDLDIDQRVEFIQLVHKYPFWRKFPPTAPISPEFLRLYNKAKDKFLHDVREYIRHD